VFDLCIILANVAVNFAKQRGKKKLGARFCTIASAVYLRMQQTNSKFSHICRGYSDNKSGTF